jgi:hypothetical protein
MGRPAFEITDDVLRQVEILAGYGLTIPQIAAVLGIAEQTLGAKRLKTAVKGALEAGRAKAEARVGKSLFERAVEGDVAAIRWWEMTRAKRSAEARIEQKTEAKITVAVQPNWQALLGSVPDAESDPA